MISAIKFDNYNNNKQRCYKTRGRVLQYTDYSAHPKQIQYDYQSNHKTNHKTYENKPKTSAPRAPFIYHYVAVVIMLLSSSLCQLVVLIMSVNFLCYRCLQHKRCCYCCTCCYSSGFSTTNNNKNTVFFFRKQTTNNNKNTVVFRKHRYF